MTKELFVSSTPHETKVGLVEDDLLAEIYLERENEYTLAGSIYKGRVTRVLPGMQSAFVDIGLERDAFLYVSDFMELEEHDEDVTDVIPANRGVPDLRAQPVPNAPPADASEIYEEGPAVPSGETGPAYEQGSEPGEHNFEGQHSAPAGGAPESADGDNRERGGWRGRRRRRGGRRDGRGDGRERSPEPRMARPAVESVPPPAVPRPQDPSRSQFGPPAGYQPIILPGESISKYRGLAQSPAPPAPRSRQDRFTRPTPELPVESPTPIAATFPDDEPIFAAAATANEPLHEQHDDLHGDVHGDVHDDVQPMRADPAESSTAVSTSVDWNREFRRQDLASENPGPAPKSVEIVEEVVEDDNEMVAVPERSNQAVVPETQVAAFAAPGTLEEETIDEEEADTVHYEEHSDE